MIKNWKSQRWQTLLNFNSRRRLLITGAPVLHAPMCFALLYWHALVYVLPPSPRKVVTKTREDKGNTLIPQ